MMASLGDIKVSEGETFQSVQAGIEALVNESGWELLNDYTIRKTFHFGTYTKVLDFNNVVGIRCKSQKHHPVTVLKFSSVTFEWTTHSPPGLSHRDVFMAKYCEEQAKAIGAVSLEDAPSCQGTKVSKA